jgi:LemA protein
MMPWGWVVLGIIVVLGIAVVVSYNRFIRQRNLVQESWRQVDVELTRRHDLVPNLVETVKGYASHERQTLEAVTAARAAAAAPGSSPAQQAVQENVLQGALRQLFAVAEAYPDLKASGGFQDLQRQLAETEDRIAASRRFYNANVRALNTRVESFPSSLVAKTFNITRAEYFTAEDPEVRANPRVSFGTDAPGSTYAAPTAPSQATAPVAPPQAAPPASPGDLPPAPTV